MAQDGSVTNGHDAKHPRNASEADAQELVISSLRAQIQDLFSQVTQLNGKLVKSYDRVSDLEDDLHVASSTLRSSTLKVSQLELERTQHLSALNTGLLVEKTHVTAELNRLMEKATEEAAQRGQAESARIAIEKDLDDLSATLFDQANTMVAEARYSKSLSERKVEEAEIALKGAEEAVASMQQQMQTLYSEKEDAERVAEEMRASMGKGKWTERRSSTIRTTRLISSHIPYQEFLLFVAHLRTLHTSTPTPPAMSTILPLPFISRLSTEDSEPTLRLDLAPSLNWLSRRSVLSAIHHGQLTIEPISSSLLYQEIFYSNNGSNTVACSLCGDALFPSFDAGPSQSNAGSWSTTLFKKYPINGVNLNGSRPTSPSFPPPLPPNSPAQVFIFKVTSPTALPTSTLVNMPISLSNIQGFGSSSSPGSSQSHTPNPQTQQSQAQSTAIYPLCSNGWCLTRLRQTCTLWAFVRSGIVEKIWEEEIPNLPASPPATEEKALVTPRKRGLWGMIGERATSWTEDKEKKRMQLEKEEKDKELDKLMAKKEKELLEKSRGKTALPPPVHPAGAKPLPHIVAPQPLVAAIPPPPRRNEARRVPPPFIAHDDQPSPLDDEAAHVPLPESRPATPVSPAAPPPLPRRAPGRRPISVSLNAGSRPGTPLVHELKDAEDKSKVQVDEGSVVKDEAVAVKTDDEQKVPSPTTAEGPAATAPPPPLPRRVRPVPPPPVVELPSPVLVQDSEEKDDDGGYDTPPESIDDVFLHHNTEDDGEHGLYIGDATWEERTWKELVKLKEDLFWARVGGMR